MTKESQGTWVFVAGTQPQGSSSCIFLPKQRGRPEASGAWGGGWLSSAASIMQGGLADPAPVPHSTLPSPASLAARSPGRWNSTLHSPKGQTESLDRNAYALKIDSRKGFPAGRPEAPFPEWHHLPFCTLKCHPIAQGH